MSKQMNFKGYRVSLPCIVTIALFQQPVRSQESSCLVETRYRPIAAGTAASGCFVNDDFFAVASSAAGVVEFDISQLAIVSAAELEIWPDVSDGAFMTIETHAHIGDGMVDECDNPACQCGGPIPIGSFQFSGAQFGQLAGFAPVRVPVTQLLNLAITQGHDFVAFRLYPASSAGCNCATIFRVDGTEQGQNVLDGISLVVQRPFESLPTQCGADAPTIVMSIPPDGFVDVRQDRTASSAQLQGIDRVRIVFSCDVRDDETHGALSTASFAMTDSFGAAPNITAVNTIQCAPPIYDVTFDRPISPGAWTTLVAHVQGANAVPIASTGNSIHLGSLPGDVNDSGISEPSDILRLIDGLNAVTLVIVERMDVNRSAQPEPSDILRLIDLLNGANTSRSWNGAALGPQP